MKHFKILITGSTGLLGLTLMTLLSNSGYEVFGFEGDISKSESFKKYEGRKYDWIIHTAAVTDVASCEKNQEHCGAVNVEGTKSIVDLASLCDSRLIYISTASVFSGEEGDYKESDVPKPVNFYNISKRLGEEEVLKYDKGIVLRLNLIGIHSSGSRGKNFLEWLFDSIQNNEDLRLFNDVYINPLSNKTIAGIISEIIQNNIIEKILHIGSSDNLSKAQVAKLFVKYFTEYKGTITECSIDTIPGPQRPKQMWLNTKHTQQVLGISMPTLQSEIDTILGSLDI